MNVWLIKPNVVNRRLCGATILGCYAVNEKRENCTEKWFHIPPHGSQSITVVLNTVRQNIQDWYGVNEKSIEELNSDEIVNAVKEGDSIIFVIRDMFSKDTARSSSFREIVILG